MDRNISAAQPMQTGFQLFKRKADDIALSRPTTGEHKPLVSKAIQQSVNESRQILVELSKI